MWNAIKENNNPGNPYYLKMYLERNKYNFRTFNQARNNIGSDCHKLVELPPNFCQLVRFEALHIKGNNMSLLDEMSVNDAITLYYEKHHAIRQGDMTKLLELKNKCPELFDKEKDEQLRDIIEYAKAFQDSDRYKELRQMELKGKLSVISNDTK